MKQSLKLFALIALIASIAAPAFAQRSIPQGMRYQAVARDAEGKALANHTIGLQIDMLAGSPGGVSVYREVHTVTTDAGGLFAITVGEGGVVSGDFSKIPWSSDEIWLQLAIDENGGRDYKIIASSRLLTVPYAFYAAAAGTVEYWDAGNTGKGCGATGIPFWTNQGNNNVSDTCHYIGTNFHEDFVFKTNAIERMRITADGDILIPGGLNIGGNLIVTKDSVTIKTKLHVDGDGDIDGDLNVDGDGTFNNIKVKNNADIGNNLTVGNNGAFGGNLSVTGNTNLTGTLNVTGNTTLSNVNAASGTIGTLNVTNGTITNLNTTALNAANGVFSTLTATNGTITTLNSTNGTINTLNSANGTITTLNSTNGTISTLNSANGTITTLNSTNGTIGTLNSTNGTITNLNTTALNAANGVFSTLTATNGTITTLNSTNGTINTLNSTNGTIGTLNSTNGTITNLNTTALNAANGVFSTLTATNGTITTLNSTNGTITTLNSTTLNVNGKGTLQGLTVSGGGMLGPDGTHVAFFENTDGSNEDGIAIKINKSSLNGENNFATFYNSSNQVIGRIEGYSFPGDWISPPPFPSPTLDIDLGLEWENVDFGLFSLSVPTGFHTPSITFGGVSPSDFTDLICWAQETGLDAFITTNPFDIALAAGTMTIAAACNDGGVTYGSKGADYAEWLPRENPDEKMVAGMIVGVKGGKISKVTAGADQVMAISMQPIVLGNTPPEDQEHLFQKVGFMGQVPVLVQGNVQVGDYILASGNNDGVGRALAPDQLTPADLPQVLGRAWSASTNPRISMINVAIGLNRNDVAGIVQQQDDRIRELENQLSQMQTGMQAQLNALSQRLEALDAGTAGALPNQR